MSVFDRLAVWWQGRKTRRKMDRVFSRREDPYGYRTGAYERERLEARGRCAGTGPRGRVREVGCAEGAFTQVLAGRAESVTALDISRVALERARRNLRSESGKVRFVETDVRAWSPARGETFDLIVLGDVLYYLDKPLTRLEFENTFVRLKSWVSLGGRVLLAHGFAGDKEREHRRGFRERFERLGLRLLDEKAIGDPAQSGGVQCLLSLLVLRREG